MNHLRLLSAIQCNRTGRLASVSPSNEDKNSHLLASQEGDLSFDRKISSPEASATAEIGAKRPYSVSAILGLPGDVGPGGSDQKRLIFASRLLFEIGT